MEHNLINILVDFAFKKVFAGDGQNSIIILQDFLNSVLNLSNSDKIKEIVYLNPFNDRENERDKQSIMDIKVKNEKDELIDIEVQINDVDDYKKRSLYYWSKLYGETIGKGDYYYNLKKSIVINILDFNLIEESDKFHNIFVVKEREDNYLFTDDLEIHYLELNKFKNDKQLDKLSDLEEWITFLKECSPSGDMKVIHELSGKKEEIGVAVDIMNKLSADELEYQRYLAREKYLMDEMSKKKYAEYKMNKVKEELEAAQKERDRIIEEKGIEEVKRIKAEKQRIRAEEERVKAEEERVKAEEEKVKAEKEKISEQNKKEELSQKAKLTVIKILKSKFSHLPIEYEEKIMSSSSEKIGELMMNIIEIEKLNEINLYLSDDNLI